MSQLVDSAIEHAQGNGSAGRAEIADTIEYDGKLGKLKSAGGAVPVIVALGGVIVALVWELGGNDHDDHERRISAIEAQQGVIIKQLDKLDAKLDQNNGLVQQVLINQPRKK